MLLKIGSESSPLEFTIIDSTVSFNRMLDCQPITIPASADYIDFLLTIRVRDFVHPQTYSPLWNIPVLQLNLVNAANDLVLSSFEAITFNDLVAFQAANIDTSFIVRMNVQSYRGSQIYSRVDLLETKHPYITEVYSFEVNKEIS